MIFSTEKVWLFVLFLYENMSLVLIWSNLLSLANSVDPIQMPQSIPVTELLALPRSRVQITLNKKNINLCFSEFSQGGKS